MTAVTEDRSLAESKRSALVSWLSLVGLVLTLWNTVLLNNAFGFYTGNVSLDSGYRKYNFYSANDQFFYYHELGFPDWLYIQCSSPATNYFVEYKPSEGHHEIWKYDKSGGSYCGKNFRKEDWRVHKFTCTNYDWHDLVCREHTCSRCERTSEYSDPDFRCYPNYDRTTLRFETGNIAYRHRHCTGDCGSQDRGSQYQYWAVCGVQLPAEQTRTIEQGGESTYTFTLDCQGERKAKFLRVKTGGDWYYGGVQIVTFESQPPGEKFLINGQAPNEVQQKRFVHDYNSSPITYVWNGDLSWDIPLIDKKCGDKVTITPSLENGYGHAMIAVVEAVYEECNLTINSFTRNREIIDPSLGESVTFIGDMTETSGASVQWTVTITDSSGASIGRTFSGTGKNPAVTWDGKDSFGTIVDDGLYTATLEAWTEDNKCRKTAGVQVTVKSSCNVTMSVSPTSVWPDVNRQYDPGAGATEADVIVTLQNPAPSSGCDIELRVESIKGSGGHTEDGFAHTGTRPKGSVAPSTISFSKGEKGSKKATYKSNVVSGKEKIKGKLIQTGNTIGEPTVSISVSGLGPLGGGSYNLKCSIQRCSGYKHEDFYNVQSWVGSLFGTIANQYHEKFPNSQLLIVTDASLRDGGLYDKDNTWSPPHKTHRVGTDIDVRSWNIPTGNRDKFGEIVCDNYGFPTLEYQGTEDEHYHLFFLPYKNTQKLCEGGMPI